MDDNDKEQRVSILDDPFLEKIEIPFQRKSDEGTLKFGDVNPQLYKTLQLHDNTMSDRTSKFKEKFEYYFLNIEPFQDEEETIKLSNATIQNAQQERSLYERKMAIIDQVIQLKQSESWEAYQKKMQESSDTKDELKRRLTNVFNLHSEFIIIWKTTFALFNVLVVFYYFFYFVFMKLESDGYVVTHRDKIWYFFMNLMFLFEFLLSAIIVYFNGGSKLTLVKLPIKLFMSIPFTLTTKHWYNFLLLFTKFIRFDLIERLFAIIEKVCGILINNYVHNYYLRIFLSYLSTLFKFLLIFFLYAHFSGVLLAYFSDRVEFTYLSGMYFTLETFTTIGYGDISPGDKSILHVIIIANMFLGVNLFYLISSNIKTLFLSVYSFNRDTSFYQQFENLIFKLQKSSNKVLSSRLKKKLSNYLIFRSSHCFKDLKEKYENVFQMCRYDVKNKIRKRLFNYLYKEYNYFFKNCSDDFMYRIFENLEPIIFKKDVEIISCGKKVDKLYFLLNGELFVYNDKGEVVISYTESTLFGDWCFLNQIVSDVSIKVNPIKSAFGFSLEKEVFEQIANDEILSLKHFFSHSYYKVMQQKKWMNSQEDSGLSPIVEENELEQLIKEKEENKKNNPNSDDLGYQIEIIKKNVNNLELNLMDLKSRIAKKL